MSSRVVRAIAAALAFLMLTPIASAQNFSDGYKFLEAIRKSDGDTVQKIMRDTNDTIVNTRDRSTGEGAIHIITRRGDAVYLRFMLQKQANPNLQDSRGNTAMMIAVESDYFEGLQILIKYGANPDLANSSGETPLIRAVQLRNTDMVEALLAAGADPDKPDSLAGMSARDYAKADRRSPQIARLLADAKKIDRSKVAGPR